MLCIIKGRSHATRNNTHKIILKSVLKRNLTTQEDNGNSIKLN